MYFFTDGVVVPYPVTVWVADVMGVSTSELVWCPVFTGFSGVMSACVETPLSPFVVNWAVDDRGRARAQREIDVLSRVSGVAGVAKLVSADRGQGWMVTQFGSPVTDLVWDDAFLGQVASTLARVRKLPTTSSDAPVTLLRLASNHDWVSASSAALNVWGVPQDQVDELTHRVSALQRWWGFGEGTAHGDTALSNWALAEPRPLLSHWDHFGVAPPGFDEVFFAAHLGSPDWACSWLADSVEVSPSVASAVSAACVLRLASGAVSTQHSQWQRYCRSMLPSALTFAGSVAP